MAGQKYDLPDEFFEAAEKPVQRAALRRKRQ
jgi:hypothetical protein